MNQEIKLGTKKVGVENPPYIIAEMSGNHNQSLEKALELVDLATDSGADAMKIQTYTPDSITLDVDSDEFRILDKGSAWFGKTLYELYSVGSTPAEWHYKIQERCHKNGIDFFSTPFDYKAVDFLEELNVPFYKIASFESIDIPLIKKVAKTGKPVIMSTGMATVGEISDAVEAFREVSLNDIILLKCTSNYPASPKDSNLLTIPHLKEMFGTHVGLSDHTMGIGVSVASVALGARVIEKHFTKSRAEGGIDSEFSLEPHEFKTLCVETKRAWQALGEIKYGGVKSEEASKKFRRSLYVSKDVKKGEVLTLENIKSIRPGFGLAPKYLEKALGRKARRELLLGHALSWSDFE